jgi:SH3-like domain-containing protein
MRQFLITAIAALFLIQSCGSPADSIQEQFDTISKEIKAQYAPDRREKSYEPILKEVDGQKVLYGSTTEQAAKDALLAALSEKGLNVLDSMIVLPDPAFEAKTWGVISHSVANVRYEADYSSEMATQLLMGTPVQLLEKRSYWYRIVTPEGYHAWVTVGSLQRMDGQELNAWKASDRMIITTYYTLFRENADLTSQVVSDGVWGNIVERVGELGGYYKVRIPDGKIGFIPKKDAESFNGWIASRKPTPENIIATSKCFLGFPYLWAGTSIKAMDCSGFTKTVHFLNGVITLRDASQQAKVGEDVNVENFPGDLQPGDLLFFGRKATDERSERITHVGIYLGEGRFIHSATNVHINSLMPDAEDFYDGTLVRARRVLNQIDQTPGLVSIAKHPWYF